MIGWNFEESFYFVMMTFTTVGFGDYHVTKRIENCSTGTMGPSTRGDNLGSTSCHDSDSVSHDHYLLITMLYILCGLILTGSTFNFLIIHCMVPKKEEITVRFYSTTLKNEYYTLSYTILESSTTLESGTTLDSVTTLEFGTTLKSGTTFDTRTSVN